MQYMLLINADEKCDSDMSEAEMGQLMADYGKFTEELQSAGGFVTSHRLRPAETATTVRVRGGETMITDGPFAETKEQLGGYYLIEAKDLDEALKWAAKIPSATYGSIEVRPVWEMGDE